MNTEQEKMLRDWSRLDWRDAARCKPQPLQAAVAALLARCEKAEAEADKNWAAFTSAFASFQGAEDERDAALAKLGVVSEACRKVVEMGEPHDPAAEVEICAAALASEPEIVAVVDSEHIDGIGHRVDFLHGVPISAIIIRGKGE